MSLIGVQNNGSEPQNAPHLTANFPSNNPFRNRAASPASYHSLPSPTTPSFNVPSTARERPVSRNPFLDSIYPPRAVSPQKAMPEARERMSPTKPAFTGHTADLFDNLTLNDRSLNNDARQLPGPAPGYRPPRPENVPPAVARRPGPPAHRPSRSEEEQRRLGTGAHHRGRPPTLDIFADPPEPRRHRLRRNSDSSIASKTLGSEEDRKRREKRHREREAKREGKPRPHGTSSKSKKPNHRLDIIDSLDVTSIYGTGLFHHDGPFDACNPHRNRKGSKIAPMQAFAKDSINNTLGGSGPVNKDLDLNQFHGRGAEGFTDYSASATATFVVDPEPYAGASAPLRRGAGVRPGVDRTTSYNPTDRVEPVHGDESLGLGTSTFLNGAPAPRSAIQRRQSESEGFGGAGGLGRKRSLAQKIRGISNANRNFDRAAGRVNSPNGTHERTITPTSPGEVQSGGGRAEVAEKTGFFNEYDDAYEKKGQKIQFAEEQNRVEGGGTRARAISSPKRGPMPGLLERRVTHDGAGASTDPEAKREGFLSRVRSLKGGKRARPERREY
ncbi:MAG: hypothetical protein LQ348_001759 [Seirophora lacunosa]|nr:MAG: hypothetical protein LQ348_001759 [Seirophora lacunosa]